jgi:hypothetical protein
MWTVFASDDVLPLYNLKMQNGDKNMSILWYLSLFVDVVGIKHIVFKGLWVVKGWGKKKKKEAKHILLIFKQIKE